MCSFFYFLSDIYTCIYVDDGCVAARCALLVLVSAFCLSEPSLSPFTDSTGGHGG